MSKPKIVSSVDVQAYAEMELRDLLNDFTQIYVGRTDDIRKKVEKDVKVNLAAYENYYKEILKEDGKVLKIKLKEFLDEVNSKAVQMEDGTLVGQITEVMKKFNDYVNIRLRKGKQQSHQDFTVMSGQLFIIYTGLEQLRNKYLTMGRKGFDVPTRKREGGGIELERLTFESGKIEKLIEKFRQIWIATKAVAELPEGMFTGEPIADITLALEEYFKNTSQTQHIANKKTQVDILSGKVAQEIKIEIQEKRSKTERLLGKARGFTRVGGVSADYTKAIKGIDFGKLKGSNPLEGEVAKQFTDIAAGKKPTAYRSAGKYKKSAKNNVKVKSRENLRKAIVRAGAASLSPIKLKATKRQSEGGVNNQRQINKLRMQINKRLPAEVRRNMGRPALINQTGRFSNSVQLTELRQGPKTLVGKYAYMFAPYETFENEGPRQWPTGYNPKPLITKSIRNLALQYTESKFTLRRE